MRKVFTIAWSNVKRMLRERSNIFFVFVFPVALILLIGAQFGARAGQKLRGEQLRLLLALLLLAVCLRFAVDLVVAPADLYSVSGRGPDA